MNWLLTVIVLELALIWVELREQRNEREQKRIQKLTKQLMDSTGELSNAVQQNKES